MVRSGVAGGWYPVGEDMLARDLSVEVPFNWNVPDGDKIRVFAREVRDAKLSAEAASKLPAIVYLQGGPGGKGGRPLARDAFLTAALKRFRVVLPDQRGTGRSAPVVGDDYKKLTPEESALKLSCLRADSIIKDFEVIREEHFGGEKWWTIGQSYGGFLTLHYLSVAPEAIVASAITGGIPSIEPDPEEVYLATFSRVREKNKQFFVRFPHLRSRVDEIADILQKNEVYLPDGDRLTVRRFQTLGLALGMSNGFDRIHWLLDEAFADEEESLLSDTFLAEVGAITSYATNPLFMVLQESIYGAGPTQWSATRELQKNPDFSEDARPLLFTGEMAFEWMADEIRALKPFAPGWKKLVEQEWPINLYDRDKLAANEVPVEAVIYFDDMYVDAELSLSTAKRVKNLNAWVTNEYEHDGIRVGKVVEKLFHNLEIRLNNVH
ncbi:MAG TPA: alpha/beta fold hydrolase [Microbacteriaceae bacterium]|nr:alpha/beta fold hydrolase [Microbacteriaceae bacterium]